MDRLLHSQSFTSRCAPKGPCLDSPASLKRLVIYPWSKQHRRHAFVPKFALQLFLPCPIPFQQSRWNHASNGISNAHSVVCLKNISLPNSAIQTVRTDPIMENCLAMPLRNPSIYVFQQLMTHKCIHLLKSFFHMASPVTSYIICHTMASRAARRNKGLYTIPVAV